MPDRRTLITLAVLVAAVAVSVAVAELSGVRLIDRVVTVMCINLILVLGLQVFMGNSGILSFAHIGFMGIGAYTTALFTLPLQMRGMVLPNLYDVLATVELSPALGIALGGLVAAMVAAALSFPLMRLSDAAAVITSFALLVVLHTIMVHWSEVTNGPRTFFGVPEATGLYQAAGVAVLAIVGALAFKESRTGVLLRASRDDEVAAHTIGANVPVLRWRGFVLSAFMAGVGGGLWAHFITSFSPNAFYLKETFVILGMLVIGGGATVTGAVVGTIAVTIAYEGLRAFENMLNTEQVFDGTVVGLTEVVLACAMIGILVLRPEGLAGSCEIGATALFRRRPQPTGERP
ncbi:MAG: branched-chain amino acid ABC transporter permease [Rhodospirillaceae bacterium]|nr:branched-chain amino acid ABC transporter permease [Rhodospirillaceae bacterium]